MLPPVLKQMKDRLEAKAYSARSTYEDELLEDLKEVDNATDQVQASNQKAMAGIQKRASSRTGPILGACPTCGR